MMIRDTISKKQKRFFNIYKDIKQYKKDSKIDFTESSRTYGCSGGTKIGVRIESTSHSVIMLASSLFDILKAISEIMPTIAQPEINIVIILFLDQNVLEVPSDDCSIIIS